jgi:peptidyl-prolyl cis-trans isomerase SurA
MKRVVSKCILFIFFTSIFTNLSAQALLTYGDQSISKEDFLKAYRKNNTIGKPTDKSYREYLELYTRYKLKVKAAYDLKLDTMPNQLAELQNFRNQIVDQYMNDEGSVNKLVNEAFLRSQKDIHLAHIFIAVPKSVLKTDTITAYKKAIDVYNVLKTGKNFGDAAAQYSEDPFAKINHGDLGYITVFTLPYALENLAYTTLPGKISKIYRGKNGYHIFKNIGERKAIGKMKAAQILLMLPGNANDAVKAETKQRADSIYQALLKGSDFSDLARKFSGDNLSYQLGGELNEFGVGKFEANFEAAAFALKKDGEISEPVLTGFGYHIIKRMHLNPVVGVKDKKTMDDLRQRVTNDPRIEIAKQEMLQTILRLAHFKQHPFNENHLFVCTDSSLQNKKLPVFDDMNNKTIMFSFSKKDIVLKDWLDYRNGLRNQPALSSGKTNKELFDLFKQTTAFEYYRNHLEDYNKEFAYQLKEFKDGNLLFEIMQHKIWDKASSDSTGLRNYYDAHKSDYSWQPSADAIIFTCSNEKTALDIQSKLPGNMSQWKRIVDSARGLAQADSGRFERMQLPPAESGNLQAGHFTSLLKNTTDNTITLAYIINVYNDRTSRSFNDARGLVINDYQAYMENNWIAALKKKYPVKINEAVLKSLPH